MVKKQASMVVIAAFCSDLTLWNAILESSLETSLSLVQSALNEQGDHFHFQIEVKGEWQHMAKFELALQAQRKTLQEPAVLQWMRSEPMTTLQHYLPYQVEVTSPLNLEAISAISYFFNSKEMIIKTLRVETYAQAKTRVPLQAVYLTVWLPLEENLPELRENFMILCDEYNLDALFELERI